MRFFVGNRSAATAVAVVVFLILLGLAIWSRLMPPAIDQAKPALNLVQFLARLFFAVWTIGVPFWLLMEFVDCRRPKQGESDSDFNARQEELRTLQEAVRPVWAGCAAAVGIMLL